MPNPLIHPKLAHLSDDEIDSLISQYYKNKPIAGLIHQYGIDCLPSQLYALLPPEISSEQCPSCGTAMVLRRLSRSAYRGESKYGLECWQCKHREKRCHCAYCRNKTRQKAPSNVRNTQSSNHPQTVVGRIRATDLSLEQAVSLFALLKCYQPEKIKSSMLLGPIKLLNTPFAPAGSHGDEIISRLIDAGLITMSAQVASRGLSLQTGRLLANNSTRFDFSNAVSSELVSDLDDLIYQRNWPDYWYEQVIEVAIDLAFAECKEFYDACASERRFPMLDDKSVNAMIRNLLEDFTTGQSFSIIQTGAKYAADFQVKHAAMPSVAANYMPGACQRFADKARKKNWTINSLRRCASCPRSMMSYVLHDFILKTQDQGLNTPMAFIQLPTKV
jgi:hypothetical protein